MTIQVTPTPILRTRWNPVKTSQHCLYIIIIKIPSILPIYELIKVNIIWFHFDHDFSGIISSGLNLANNFWNLTSIIPLSSAVVITIKETTIIGRICDAKGLICFPSTTFLSPILFASSYFVRKTCKMALNWL